MKLYNHNIFNNIIRPCEAHGYDGWITIASSPCGDGDECITGNKLLCSNSILPYKHYYWIGSH